SPPGAGGCPLSPTPDASMGVRQGSVAPSAPRTGGHLSLAREGAGRNFVLLPVGRGEFWPMSSRVFSGSISFPARRVAVLIEGRNPLGPSDDRGGLGVMGESERYGNVQRL